MPVYKAKDMVATADVKRPHIAMVQFGGELIKVGIYTYQAGEMPPPHIHPNDEQFAYVLEGRAAHLCGDEITVVGPGDLIHVPRNTVHGMRILDAPIRMFSSKSPAGSGKLSEDYVAVANVAELEQRLAEYKE
jgi:quercetin dioxygenase-like cupin family protein